MFTIPVEVPREEALVALDNGQTITFIGVNGEAKIHRIVAENDGSIWYYLVAPYFSGYIDASKEDVWDRVERYCGPSKGGD